jgi:hypothetical protein
MATYPEPITAGAFAALSAKEKRARYSQFVAAAKQWQADHSQE